MFTVTFSAGTVFTFGIVAGLIIGAVVLVAVAFAANKKNK